VLAALILTIDCHPERSAAGAETRVRSSASIQSINVFTFKEKHHENVPGNEIRNVAVVGHAHSGKTTLIAALLHAAKMTPTQGHVADGTAVTAYDEEDSPRRDDAERRGLCRVQGVKINLVDTPASTCSPTKPAPRCCRWRPQSCWSTLRTAWRP